jgi:hypothetical protein
VDRLPRRGLILGGLAAGALGALELLGRAERPTAAPALDAGERAYTFDRGGIVRWDNGKRNVATPFPFGLRSAERALPLVIGEWRGADFPLNLEAYTSVLPEALINRSYDSSDGQQIAFTAIGSNSTRKLHRPDICYQAADWKLSPLPAGEIALGEGSVAPGRFVATHAGARQQNLIAYWYLWMDHRRRIEDGAFVMHLSTSLRGRSLGEAEATIARFLRVLMPRALPTPGLLGGMA